MVSTPQEDLRNLIAQDCHNAQRVMASNNLHRMLDNERYSCPNDNVRHNTMVSPHRRNLQTERMTEVNNALLAQAGRNRD